MKRLRKTVDLNSDSNDKPLPGAPRPIEVETSLIAGDHNPPQHLPVIDIDLPCELRPSETPGHFHLLIDKAMPEKDYWRLLNVLAEVGIVQEGFVNASMARGFTSVALHPWKKQS